jgi:hypothetical protein
MAQKLSDLPERSAGETAAEVRRRAGPSAGRPQGRGRGQGEDPERAGGPQGAQVRAGGTDSGEAICTLKGP